MKITPPPGTRRHTAPGESSSSGATGASPRRFAGLAEHPLAGLPARLGLEEMPQFDGTSPSREEAASSAAPSASTHLRRSHLPNLDRSSLSRQFGWTEAEVFANFDSQGQWVIAANAEKLERNSSESALQALASVPRVLASRDSQRLAELSNRLRDSGRSGGMLLDPAGLCREAGVSAAAVKHLFGAQGLNKDRAVALPPSQRALLNVFLDGDSDAIRQSRALIRAQHRLASRHLGYGLVAAEAGLETEFLKSILSGKGHLLITPRAATLLQSSTGEFHAHFVQMPRALIAADARRLAAVLTSHPGSDDKELRLACQEAGLSPAALQFLFVEGTELRSRVDALPKMQQNAIMAATVAAGPLGGHVRNDSAHLARLLVGQEALAGGATYDAVSKHIGIDYRIVKKGFTTEGHLVLGSVADGWLANEEFGARFAAVPRALGKADLQTLARVLEGKPRADDGVLRAEAVQAGLSSSALTYLFNAGVPMLERLGTLPAQQRELLAQAPVDSALIGQLVQERETRLARVIEAHQALVGGIGYQAAADHAAMAKSAVRDLFQKDGALLVTGPAESLLSDAGGHATRLSAIPRALTRRDLGVLQRVLREQPGADDVQLLHACVASGLSKAAQSYLFGSGATLVDRLAGLTAPQRSMAALLARPAGASDAAPAAAAPDAGPVARIADPLVASYAAMLGIVPLLAQGRTYRAACTEVGVQRQAAYRLVTKAGELKLEAPAAKLLADRTPGLQERLATLPIVLSRTDFDGAVRLLSRYRGADQASLALVATKAAISPYAQNYLFAETAHLASRISTLSERQREVLQKLLLPVQRPTPVRTSPVRSAQSVSPQGGGLSDPGTPQLADLRLAWSPESRLPILPVGPQASESSRARATTPLSSHRPPKRAQLDSPSTSPPPASLTWGRTAPRSQRGDVGLADPGTPQSADLLASSFDPHRAAEPIAWAATASSKRQRMASQSPDRTGADVAREEATRPSVPRRP